MFPESCSDRASQFELWFADHEVVELESNWRFIPSSEFRGECQRRDIPCREIKGETLSSSVDSESVEKNFYSNFKTLSIRYMKRSFEIYSKSSCIFLK